MKQSDDPTRVEVVDCTLRDGEQAPGVWLTIDQKVELARMLSAAGVDVLDAGFPAAGQEEMEALTRMRQAGLRAHVGATSRLVMRDIQAALAAQAESLFLFAPISDVQRERTLGIDRVQLLRIFIDSVQWAASNGLEVSLVLGDATQADSEYLCHLAVECQGLPIERLILCDSMGLAVPSQVAAMVRAVHSAAPSHRLCVHCHNDFGMATANTVAALEAGATSFTATVNGIGERAGNADLAEVLAAASHLLGRTHGVNPQLLPQLSQTVERMTGIHMSPIKPVTGMNVYRHESGIHVDAILKEPTSYQALPPWWIGAKMELVLGKHSGTAQIRGMLQSRNLPCDAHTVSLVMEVLKKSRDRCERSDLEDMYDRVELFRSRVLSGIPIDALLDEAFPNLRTQCGAG